jgi:hypothetical protein
MANTKITVANMAANSIDSDQYVDGSIDTAHIADGQITVGKMAANSVDSAQYVDGSIDTAHYADNSITGAELADNIVIAGTLGSTGKITADAGIDIDNFNIDGTTIALSSGDMTLDVAGDMIIDVDGGDIYLNDGGTGRGQISMANTDLTIISATSDRDLIFKGVDGASVITALTLDMSNAGLATFNAGATFGAGIDVTGTATMDGLTVVGSEVLFDNTGGDFTLKLHTNAVSDKNEIIMGDTGTPLAKFGVSGTANDIITGSDGQDFNIGTAGGGRAINFSTDNFASVEMKFDGARLLVGKTSSGVSGVGAELRDGAANYCVTGTSSGHPVTLFNRTSDNGDIIAFRKDNSAIGSIGVNTGDKIYLGTGASGVAFSTAGLLPFSPSANNWSDNSLNLGLGGIRWKDLYLSGGVHLGGTGAANKLDDYEEGTWTPTWTNGIGNGSTSGTYVKVGNIVHVTALFTMGSTTSIGNKLEATNLPFTASQTTYSGARYENYQQNSYIGATRAASSQLRGYVINTAGSQATELIASTNAPFTWGVNDYAQLAVTYKTG